MKKINFIIPILGFTILLNNQIIYSQENKTNIVKSEQKRCSLFIEGLEFCINTSNISVKAGEPVILHYSIKNLTEREITINGGNRGGSGILQLTVNDENGFKIPTILETLIEKQKKGVLSKEESEKFISFFFHSGPRSSYFEPNEISEWFWNLNRLYDFKNKGKYYIEINKKLPNHKESNIAGAFLGKIEVEVR